MNKFIGLTKRNLLIFFKDKQSVIFSLMTSIIVFVLYLLFLRGTFVDAIQSAMKEAPGLADLVQDKDVKMYANLTLLVGILGSALITVPFNCLTVVVRDKENKVDYDILSTPIRRWQVILSYFTAVSICCSRALSKAFCSRMVTWHAGKILQTVCTPSENWDMGM